ncbi:MAG: DinB family protein [Phycisphaerae bacterium]
MPVSTFQELFAYYDWARGVLLSRAAALADEALDKPFDMGPGSLRATLTHLYAAERHWFKRWCVDDGADPPRGRDLKSLPELCEAWTVLARRRNRFLSGADRAALGRLVTFQDADGRDRTATVRDTLLQVCNHGEHHRAQALNMLR